MSYQNAHFSKFKFVCEKCDYYTNKKYDFNRHIKSIKHMSYQNAQNAQNAYFNDFTCNCGKKYKYKQGLSNHKKKCSLENNIILKNKNNLEDLVVQLVSENNDIKNTLIEENKKLKKQLIEHSNQLNEILPKIGNTTNITNNNQKLNINLFLNEKCKDAISIKDFIQQIEISLKNLLITKDKGLGIGLSNIIRENMNKLSIYERPIHCTDKKRETLYIKNSTWEKDKDLEKTKELFKDIQSKQFKTMKKWINEHPNYMIDDNLKHEYIILVNKCSSNLNEHENKIMKNLCENTYIKDEITN
jgi:hypothetical protein